MGFLLLFVVAAFVAVVVVVVGCCRCCCGCRRCCLSLSLLLLLLFVHVASAVVVYTEPRMGTNCVLRRSCYPSLQRRQFRPGKDDAASLLTGLPFRAGTTCEGCGAGSQSAKCQSLCMRRAGCRIRKGLVHACLREGSP